jgi:deoxyribodipyrimidine photo-lyase
MSVPELRVRALNDARVNAKGDFVLYWMVAFRRRHDNYALERAVEIAKELAKPLVVLEALRSEYRWASDRLHRFVIDGMADNERAFASSKALYYPYVEPEHDAGKGLLAALAGRACAVVTCDFPCFFLPRMQAAAAKQLRVRLEAVDGNGLLPIRAPGRAFARAYDFRRYLQRELLPHLGAPPLEDPLARAALPVLKALPPAITKRWPRADARLLAGDVGRLAALPIDHGVHVAGLEGGARGARKRLAAFLEHGLARYDDDRNHPASRATSGLSPYLHFGHLSPHRIFRAIAEREEWSPEHAGKKARGDKSGFWRMHPSSEAYLDQLVTWRELGYNFCTFRSDYDRFPSLPDWAQKTLAKHRRDERARTYTLTELARAETYDELWNAAQRELARTGTMHNYLRMLWGKKVLEWTERPETALERLIELNNRYALDGRNPNSYSGIFWCFGRYDRPWGPERPIFGTVRYMSSESTRRKLRLGDYLERFGEEE